MKIIYIEKIFNKNQGFKNLLNLKLSGLRFNIGWIFGRKHHLKEDGRWNVWRERYIKIYFNI